ncbi:MAG: amylo-alpha-1,6-glucosidase, partial [Blastocatellia bacterium]
NGSVWPHDNAIIARGLARYGFRKEGLSIMSGLFEAGHFMEMYRLPELFCGFHRRSATEGPTLYPVACSPQSWAAGSVYLLLEACLGMRIAPRDKCIRFEAPCLPDYVTDLLVENLRVQDAEIDFAIRNEGNQVTVEVVRTKGDLRVQIS